MTKSETIATTMNLAVKTGHMMLTNGQTCQQSLGASGARARASLHCNRAAIELILARFRNEQAFARFSTAGP
jgi:hypothetical protein